MGLLHIKDLPSCLVLMYLLNVESFLKLDKEMIDEEEYWFHQNKRLDFELQQQKVQIVHICMFFR